MSDLNSGPIGTRDPWRELHRLYALIADILESYTDVDIR